MSPTHKAAADLPEKADVVIVGGGIIGLCTAFHLNAAGADVTVLDRGTMDDGASYVNAGYLVPSHLEPIAAPGVIRKGLKWLSNPESPFYIKPRFDIELTRWLWGFQASCTHEHVKESVPILRDLAEAGQALYDEMTRLPGLEHTAPRKSGLLMLHHGEDAALHNKTLAELALKAGVAARELTKDETLELEPGIRSDLTGSVYFPDDWSFDPGVFMEALKTYLLEAGVAIFTETEVTGFSISGDVISEVKTSRGRIACENVVLAAGSWSGVVAKGLGIRIPVQPATGYSITVDEPGFNLGIPLILADENITIGTMRAGNGTERFRVAGTLTLVGFDRKIDTRRVKPLERQIQLYIDRVAEGKLAMPAVRSGFRPASLDGLPIIGRPKGFSNLIVATGHGMLGMTQGPVTGKLVLEIIEDRPTIIDLEPISPNRF